MTYKVTDTIFLILFLVCVNVIYGNSTTKATSTGQNILSGSPQLIPSTTQNPSIILSNSDKSTLSFLPDASSSISSEEASQIGTDQLASSSMFFNNQEYSSVTNFTETQYLSTPYSSIDVQENASSCILMVSETYFSAESHSCIISSTGQISAQSLALHQSSIETFSPSSPSEILSTEHVSNVTEMMTVMSSNRSQSLQESLFSTLLKTMYETSHSETLSTFPEASSVILAYAKHTTITSNGVEPSFESSLPHITISSLTQVISSTETPNVAETTPFISIPSTVQDSTFSSTLSGSQVASFIHISHTMDVEPSTIVSYSSATSSFTSQSGHVVPAISSTEISSTPLPSVTMVPTDKVSTTSSATPASEHVNLASSAFTSAATSTVAQMLENSTASDTFSTTSSSMQVAPISLESSRSSVTSRSVKSTESTDSFTTSLSVHVLLTSTQSATFFILSSSASSSVYTSSTTSPSVNVVTTSTTSSRFMSTSTLLMMNSVSSATALSLSSALPYSVTTQPAVNITSTLTSKVALYSIPTTMTPFSTTPQESASSSVELTNSVTSPTSSAPTEKQTITTVGETVIYPTLKPSESAVYKFTFVFVLDGQFDRLVASNQKDQDKFKEDLRQQLMEKIFSGTDFTEICVLSFSKGSVKSQTEVKLKVTNVTDFSKNMDILHNNTVTHAGSINTTFGKCDEQKTIEEINSIISIYKANPERYVLNACPKSYEYRQDGKCHHVCDSKGIEFCGSNGECVYSGTENVAVCQCSEEPLYIYHGDKCEERTPKLTFYLAVTLGVGGGVVLILVITIICLACRRERSRRKKGLKVAYDDPSGWSFPNESVAMGNLSFRYSKKFASPENQYNRPTGQTNKAYEGIAPDEIIMPMYFPPKSDISNSRHQDDITSRRESLKNIDTSQTYSIRRPKVSNEPNELYYSISGPRK